MDLLSRFEVREDFHQSIEFAQVMESIGWVSIPIGSSRYAIRPIGPVALSKMQRAHEYDLRAIARYHKNLRIFRTILEPARIGEIIDLHGKRYSYSFNNAEQTAKAITLFAKSGYSVCREHYAHSKTAILDLSHSLSEIIAQFPSKTRYNVKIALRKQNEYDCIPFSQVTDRQKQEFFTLHTLWSAQYKIYGYSNDFLDSLLSAFSRKGVFIRAATNGEFSGAMFLFVHDRVGYYFYTTTTAEGKKAHVPTGLTIKALEQSKELGADIFDFCSVYDERYPSDHPRWQGFTEFKSRFKPVDVYYPPSFSRWL